MQSLPKACTPTFLWEGATFCAHELRNIGFRSLFAVLEQLSQLNCDAVRAQKGARRTIMGSLSSNALLRKRKSAIRLCACVPICVISSSSAARRPPLLGPACRFLM